MSKPQLRLPKDIVRALNDTGKAWSVEAGGRHWKLKVEDTLIGIIPYGKIPEMGRGKLNLLSQIRRASDV